MKGETQDSRTVPLTFLIGKKANELYKKLAIENGIDPKYFLTKLLVREARAEASALPVEKLKERLRLIDDVNDELVDIINNPPKGQLTTNYKLNKNAIYQRVWVTRKRLKAKGISEKDIHQYCIDKYGVDYNITPREKK